jgi:hypothetical protein
MTIITPVSPHLHNNPITSPGLEKVKVKRIHRYTVDTFVERLQQLQRDKPFKVNWNENQNELLTIQGQ